MLWSVDVDSARPLGEQITANIRRAIAEGTLTEGERLPTAAELAGLLRVNANTVLSAYRRLREEGVLEFRRGRGVRVAASVAARMPVVEAVRQLVEVGRTHGYSTAELAELVVDLGPGERT